MFPSDTLSPVWLWSLLVRRMRLESNGGYGQLFSRLVLYQRPYLQARIEYVIKPRHSQHYSHIRAIHLITLRINLHLLRTTAAAASG